MAPKLPVRQLLILAICRFSEPLVFTSVLPYLPELLEYVGVAKADVAKWAGITSAAAALSQAFTAVSWGTLSDYVGRKPVILFGLTCTMVLSVVLGMSQSLTTVLISRTMIGLMNGNVGILRTMVAEIVPERELQPRAFSIMPTVWTIGSIFGPSFGGALAHPAEKYPNIFGSSEFLRRFPFALPNLISACVFIFGITVGFLFLHETLETKKDQRDVGLEIGKVLTGSCTSRRKGDLERKAVDEESASLLPKSSLKSSKKDQPIKRVSHSWSQIFTFQSSIILVAYTLMSGFGMAFDSVFPVFLHYPVQQLHENLDVNLPFKFASGFGVDSQTIGTYYTIIGIIGMFIQFYLFPPVVKRYGVLKCYQVSAICMPIIFLLTPFTALVPGVLRTPVVIFVMLAKLSTTIFGIPCCTILLTNSASSMAVLGTLNGVGTSFSALGRAAGPAVIGSAFSYGVKEGYVLFPWWLLSALALWGILPGLWIIEQEGPSRAVLEEEDADIEYGQGNESEDGY
ncbi:MFS transporter, partial [Penicillium taxi]|uniref:MFS transporter n=1 Tax=Penicillium taxi TaxID=168475 RepID=UPI002544E97B